MKSKNSFYIYFVLLFSVFSLFQNCSRTKFSDLGDKPEIQTANSIAAVTCFFNGKNLSEGERVIAYLTSSVPFGDNCSYQERICTKNGLSGSFPYPTCSPGAPKSCLLGASHVVDHGKSVLAYKSPNGDTCVGIVRNCFDGNLDGDQSYVYDSCVPTVTNSKILPITGTSSYSPFKLLLVVDNSYTMSQSQAKLSKNIDTLLLPLKGLNVDVKVITTTDEPQENNSNFKFIKADGSFTEANFQSYTSVESLDQYKQADIVKIEKRHQYTESQGKVFNMKTADSSATTDSTISKLKTYILSLGTDGSDNETVLCPILRHFENLKTNSFYSVNDKTAIVVLTDEDDHSVASECKSLFGFDYGPVSTDAGSEGDYFDFKVNAVDIEYSYKTSWDDVFADGVLKLAKGEATETATIKISWTDINQDDVTAGKCFEKSQQMVRALADRTDYRYTGSGNSYPIKIVYKNSTVSKCFISEFSRSYYIYSNDVSYGKDFCDLSVKNEKGQNLSEIPDALSYTTGVFSTGISHYSGGCSETHFSNPASYRRNGLSLDLSSNLVGTLSKTTTTTNLEKYLIDRMNTLFGSNVFLSIITNPSSGACVLQSGQSLGTRYEGLAALNSAAIKIFPICSDSYKDAIAATANFVTEVANQGLKMGLPANAVVGDVYLDLVKLDKSKYEIVKDNITLKLPVNVGQIVKIVYTIKQ